MEEMLAVFSISRKAQNFWHYRTMCSMPGFDELSSRYSTADKNRGNYNCDEVNIYKDGLFGFVATPTLSVKGKCSLNFPRQISGLVQNG